MTAPNRRWLQFRLKTLFLIVATLCVPLAWVGVRLNQKRQERAVIAEIERLGGNVSYDWQREGARSGYLQQPGPRWLRRILGDDFFAAVVTVTLPAERERVRTKLKNSWVPGEIDWSELYPVLFPDGPVIDDEGLKTVATLTHLEELFLDWTDIGDAGLANLSTLAKLRYLDLQHTNVTDAAIGHLQKFTGLERLNLQGTEITDEGEARLRGALPNCEIIR